MTRYEQNKCEMTARCCVVCAPPPHSSPRSPLTAQMAPVRPWSLLQACPRPPPTPPTDTTVMLRPSHTLLKRLDLTRTTCGFRRSADALSHSQIIIFLPTFLTVGVAPSKATRTPPSNPRPASPRQGSRDKGHGGTACPPATGEEVADLGGKGNFYGEGNHWNGVIITGGSGDTQGDTRVCWV